MTTKDNDALAVSAVRAWCRSGRAAEIRRHAQLSRAEVARTIAVSAATVSRWEVGQRTPQGAPAVRYHRLLTRLAEGVAARQAGSAA